VGLNSNSRSIDLETYERQCDRLREELTLVKIDRHGSLVRELDVEEIMAFPERVLPRAARPGCSESP
jgi:hypothetical protein